MAKSASILRWERIRARGLARYVLVNGVLSYGLPLFALMTFVVHRAHLTVLFVIASALLWALGGALFGWVMWHVRGRMYRRLAQLLGAEGPD
ncbi:hypothetical protein BH11PSE14_BH11PSE14_14390 [soil metagenome]